MIKNMVLNIIITGLIISTISIIVSKLRIIISIAIIGTRVFSSLWDECTADRMRGASNQACRKFG